MEGGEKKGGGGENASSSARILKVDRDFLAMKPGKKKKGMKLEVSGQDPDCQSPVREAEKRMGRGYVYSLLETATNLPCQ